MKQRIFFDMDGVLALWESASIEEQTSVGFFLNRKPVQAVLEMLTLIRAADMFDIYILSSVYNDNHSKAEKVAWNRLYTGVPMSNQIYVPYGTDKGQALAALGGIRNTDVLIDDFTPNLLKWSGIAIKMYNGINGTHGKWHGFCVHSTMEPDLMAKQVMAIAIATA